MIKKYVRIDPQVLYGAVMYDGSEESLNEIHEMCNGEAVIISGSGKLSIGNECGYTEANVGDYVVCGGSECLHSVKGEYFVEHYRDTSFDIKLNDDEVEMI